jgi:hypothetical protein
MLPPNTPAGTTPDVGGDIRDVVEYLDESFTVGPIYGFSDLMWDMDLTMEEIHAFKAGVDLGCAGSTRRLVAQRIRGEIRYWLSTERDPMRMDDAEMELGVVSSVPALADLCREFLPTNTPLQALRCRRRVRG